MDVNKDLGKKTRDVVITAPYGFEKSATKTIPAEITENLPEVKILYHGDIPELEQHGNFIDLACAEDVELKAGEFKLISFGISVELPEGYWAQVVPRSSTFKKYGILMANSFGVIDSDYCGEDDVWMMPVYATRDIKIEKGTRIAQFRVVEDQPFVLVKTNKLEGKNRGGFGSTGN